MKSLNIIILIFISLKSNTNAQNEENCHKCFTVPVMYDFQELNKPAVPIFKNELIECKKKYKMSFIN